MSFILRVKKLNYSYILLFIHSYSFPHTITNIVIVTFIVTFIDLMKELPITLILRPFNFDTLSTLTYDLISQAQFFQSSVPSLLIVCISLPAIVLINRQVDKGV